MKGTLTTSACILLIAILLAAPGWGQRELSLSAEISSETITTDDATTLQVTVKGENIMHVPKPRIEGLEKDFQIRQGQTSTGLNFINGKMSTHITMTYTLIPRRAGTFTVGPVVLEHQGRTYRTETFTIKVTKGAGAPSRPQAPPGIPPGYSPVAPGQIFSHRRPGSPSAPAGPAVPGRGSSRPLFVTATVDSKRVFAGQAVTWTFRLYRMPSLQLTTSPQYSAPQTTGFWAEELPPERDYEVTLKGETYAVSEVKMAFVPLAPGQFTIPPATLICNVEDSSSPFGDDDFPHGLFNFSRPVKLSTEAIAIRALPLPGERPKDFTGAVGEFTVTSSVDKKEVRAGEPVALNVEVRGAGNIKAIGPPPVPDIADTKKYDTTSTESIETKSYRLSGAKVFQTMIVPLKEGPLTIPAISFSWFDPVRSEYHTVKTEALTLQVIPGAVSAGAAPAPIPTAGGSEVSVTARDIRYLKTSPGNLRRAALPLYRNPTFLSLLPLPLLALLLLAALQHAQRMREKDPAALRRRCAVVKAKRHVSVLKSAQGDIAGAYSSLAKGLLDYIADRLGVAAGSLTLAEVRETLKHGGAGEEAAARAVELLKEWDFARFAPAQLTAESLRAALQRYRDIIEALEKETR